LPLLKSLERGETVALEFSIVREGYYSETAYKFRYFRSEGTGTLSDSYGTTIPVNRFRNIPSDDFVLYYSDNRQQRRNRNGRKISSVFNQKSESNVSSGC
jgi:hypothetical protein